MSTTSRPLARNALTLGASAAALGLLWSIAPPTVEWRSLLASPAVTATDVAQLVTLVGRLLASASLAYLVLACCLNLIACGAPGAGNARRLVRWAGLLTPRWLAVASVGAVTSTMLLSPVAGAATERDQGTRREDVRLEVVQDGGVTGAPRTVLPWATASPPLPDPPRLSSVPATGAGDRQAGQRGGQQGDPQGDPAPPAVMAQDPPPTTGTHTVQPGEHFWSIAERVHAERGLDVPVGQYWRLLVEANRSRLVDRDDPDLLHPGQVLVLP